MDSIKNAKSDMEARGLLEARNEGNSMLKSLEKFHRDNKAFLNDDQNKMISGFISDLDGLNKGEDKNAIHAKIKEINTFTEPLANEALTRIVKNEITSD